MDNEVKDDYRSLLLREKAWLDKVLDESPLHTYDSLIEWGKENQDEEKRITCKFSDNLIVIAGVTKEDDGSRAVVVDFVYNVKFLRRVQWSIEEYINNVSTMKEQTKQSKVFTKNNFAKLVNSYLEGVRNERYHG